MKTLILATLLVCNLTGFSQADSLIKYINPPDLITPVGYSHVAVVNLGASDMIVISGQVPFDNKGNIIGKDDFTKQTEQVFKNMKTAVEAAGGSFTDIIKITVFVTDASQLPVFRTIRNKYINIQKPPTSSFIEVRKLFREDVLIEVEATAIVHRSQKK